MWIGGVRVILFNEKDRLLLVKQKHEERSFWLLPGGAIELGETSEAAGIREVYEETGLNIEITGLLWHMEDVTEERGQRFVSYMTGRVLSGDLKLGRDPELDEDKQVLTDIRYCTREEVLEFPNVFPEMLKDKLWYDLENKKFKSYILKEEIS